MDILDKFNTKIFRLNGLDPKSLNYCRCIEEVAIMLKKGGLVAIPTETVYGLAANALDETAVNKIYKVKGRPPDNPLIVHISDMDMLSMLTDDFPKIGYKLAEKFWGGPLTLIVKRSSNVPDIISAGLDSVAIRFPSHRIALDIIKAAGVPLAAPSANISGSPSTSTAQHCIDDLFGRIDAIVDGGGCTIGIESTVVSLLTDIPTILRPGLITPKQIESVTGKVAVSHAVTEKLSENEHPLSPGMQYKHYSPKAKVVLIDGDIQSFIGYISKQTGENIFVLSESENLNLKNSIFIGKTHEEQAARLFDALRQADFSGATEIFVRCPKAEGVGLALYNRLIRAAAYNIIYLAGE